MGKLSKSGTPLNDQSNARFKETSSPAVANVMEPTFMPKITAVEQRSGVEGSISPTSPANLPLTEDSMDADAAANRAKKQGMAGV